MRGLDLDDCLQDGELTDVADEAVSFLDSYTEVTPSGRGLRVWVLAPGFSHSRKKYAHVKAETYSYDRFYTLTGIPYRNEPIRERLDKFSTLWKRLGVRDHDEKILDKLKKQDQAWQLFEGKTSSDYGDGRSDADFALAKEFARLTKDPKQIERLMWRSGLVRTEETTPDDPKWDRDDYLAKHTIPNALEEVEGEKASGRNQTDPDYWYRLYKAQSEGRERLRSEQVTRISFPDSSWSLKNELAEPRIEDVWRVGGLQQVSGNVVLIAGYKLGKTTLILNLSRSLVDGTPFLDDRYEVEPVDSNVAIFNYELTKRQWVDWTRDMEIQNTERIKPVHLRGLGALQFWVPALQDQLVDWMIENNIKYWILDPTAQAWSTLLESEGDNIRADQFTKAIDAVKKRASIGEANLTHHTSRDPRKQNQGRGPSSLEGWYDAGWFLTGQRNKLKFHAIGRDVDVEQFPLIYNEADRRTFWISDRAEQYQEKSEQYEQEKKSRGALRILIAVVELETALEHGATKHPKKSERALKTVSRNAVKDQMTGDTAKLTEWAKLAQSKGWITTTTGGPSTVFASTEKGRKELGSNDQEEANNPG